MSLQCSANDWADKAQKMAQKNDTDRNSEVINAKFKATDFYLPNHIHNLKLIYNSTQL